MDKLDMMEVGTRYEHWQELKELWMSGVLVLERISDSWKSKNDTINLYKLNGAIELLQKQMDRMAELEQKKWGLAREIDAIPFKKLLKAGDNVTQGSDPKTEGKPGDEPTGRTETRDQNPEDGLGCV